jgi:hypothetical protein
VVASLKTLVLASLALGAALVVAGVKGLRHLE